MNVNDDGGDELLCSSLIPQKIQYILPLIIVIRNNVIKFIMMTII
jgi:hypothetical protein